MKMEVTTILLALAVSGCGSSTDAPTPSSRVDRAGSTPIAERFRSVTNRIRPGMSMIQAKALVGDCIRARFHGPRTDMSTGTTTNYEEWAWLIDASNGQIVVHSTTGLESDLEHGIVASVSYGTNYPVHSVTNEMNTANNGADHIR